MQAQLPAGYVDLDTGRWRVIAQRLDLEAMVNLLERARSGAPLNGNGVDQGVVAGRGGTRRIVLPGGKAVYLRKYLRGGAARFVVRDLYFLRPPRPVRELIATETARAAGCRVPTVHAVCVDEAGPFYRGWIVTSAIEGATPFIEAFVAGDPRERARLLGEAGHSIRCLNDAGVYHVDLTGHNLLIDADGAIDVIDFDRARVGAPAEHRLAEQGLDRFWRSLAKLMPARGEELDAKERRWLERGYLR